MTRDEGNFTPGADLHTLKIKTLKSVKSHKIGFLREIEIFFFRQITTQNPPESVPLFKWRIDMS